MIRCIPTRTTTKTMTSDFLKISPRITVLPVIHGSGDCAIEVRRVMLEERFDCLAVPLPPSFRADVERAIDFLPAITVVTQAEQAGYAAPDWRPDGDSEEDEDAPDAVSYVPIDPCQPVIAALRIALGRTDPSGVHRSGNGGLRTVFGGMPDPYALKEVPLDKFSAAVLPAIPACRPVRRPTGSWRWRRTCVCSNESTNRFCWSHRSWTGPGSRMPISRRLLSRPTTNRWWQQKSVQSIRGRCCLPWGNCRLSPGSTSGPANSSTTTRI